MGTLHTLYTIKILNENEYYFDGRARDILRFEGIMVIGPKETVFLFFRLMTPSKKYFIINSTTAEVPYRA